MARYFGLPRRAPIVSTAQFLVGNFATFSPLSAGSSFGSANHFALLYIGQLSATTSLANLESLTPSRIEVADSHEAHSDNAQTSATL